MDVLLYNDKKLIRAIRNVVKVKCHDGILYVVQDNISHEDGHEGEHRTDVINYKMKEFDYFEVKN